MTGAVGFVRERRGENVEISGSPCEPWKANNGESLVQRGAIAANMQAEAVWGGNESTHWHDRLIQARAGDKEGAPQPVVK
jgi:hypothetical protein